MPQQCSATGDVTFCPTLGAASQEVTLATNASDNTHDIDRALQESAGFANSDGGSWQDRGQEPTNNSLRDWVEGSVDFQDFLAAHDSASEREQPAAVAAAFEHAASAAAAAAESEQNGAASSAQDGSIAGIGSSNGGRQWDTEGGSLRSGRDPRSLRAPGPVFAKLLVSELAVGSIIGKGGSNLSSETATHSSSECVEIHQLSLQPRLQ